MLFSLLPPCLLECILSTRALTARDLTSLLNATLHTPLHLQLTAATQAAARLHLLSSSVGTRLLAAKRPTETFLSLFHALHLLDTVDISTATNHATSIWSCGRNDVGQGARDSPADSNIISESLRVASSGGEFVGPPADVLFVAAGANHSACVTICGRLQVVGENRRGQLGLGDCMGRKAWTMVGGILGRMCQVACGGMHTVVLNGEGGVLVSGANDHGQLGVQGGRAVGGVAQFCAVRAFESGVVMIAAGSAHTVLLTADGRVFGAGNNSSGQLGGKQGGERGMFEPVGCFGRKVVRVACGGNTTMMLTTDNMILVTGKRQCGLSVIGGLGLCRVTHLSVGDGFAIARTAENDVAVSVHRKRFHVAEEMRGVRARCVSAGISHYAIVTEEGGVLAGGGNAFGQVGSEPNYPMGLTIEGGQNARIIRPYRVPLSSVRIPKGYRALQVAAGAFHTLFLLEQVDKV